MRYLIVLLCLVMAAFVLYVGQPLPLKPARFVVEDRVFPEGLTQFQSTLISPSTGIPPNILNCQAVDLDGDNKDELVVCDQSKNAVFIYHKVNGTWVEEALSTNLLAPCSVHFADLDGDEDLDCVVACLGDLYPTDAPVGSVVAFEKTQGSYKRRAIINQLRRVTDVRSGDLDNDGDVDLAVAVFGHAHGKVLWLEQESLWSYKEHVLHRAAGAIHIPIADFDSDGDLDIAANISQDDEEVLLFENTGNGTFATKTLFKSINYDLGISGLFIGDLDNDKDHDLVLTCGDNLESNHHYPQPYHGCYSLINNGSLNFTAKKIVDLPGCYGAALGDIDNDGDMDIALVSMINNWANEDCSSLIWLENDGRQNYTPWHIANDPIQLVSCCVGDFSGDGKNSIIAGSLHIFPPFERMERLCEWSPIDSAQSKAP